MVYDVVVVGSGIAGLMAAIEAKTQSNRVAIISKSNVFKSNSSLASGGINAVTNAKLSQIQEHIDDTYKSGKGLADMKSVLYMCHSAVKVIQKLSSYGVAFDSDGEGTILQRGFGGTKAKRTCFVGDKTGAAITMALIKKAKAMGITLIPNTYVLDIAKIENRVSGVVALRKFDSSVVVYPCKALVFAGGGYAGIYRGHTTNATDYTGDLLSVALRNGLKLKDMEFVQFHPTGFTKTSYLVSEAARGEGGYLRNSEGERFVDELETRDVVSRAILRQIERGSEVYLDLTHLDEQVIEDRLPSLNKAAVMQAGIDIKTQWLPIQPVAHYSMGGIANKMTKTAIAGLFVCGECGCSGVHGANRLGGNSLLEGAVFGELAGKNALEYSLKKSFLPVDYKDVIKHIEFVDRCFQSDTTKNFNAVRISMGKTMFEKGGIIRDAKGLQKAREYMGYLRRECAQLYCIDKSRKNNVELIGILELKNALEVAEVTLLSAQKRCESRGAHYRSDFENAHSEFEKSIEAKRRGSFYQVEFENSGYLARLREFLTN